jgi:hypothetical protein
MVNRGAKIAKKIRRQCSTIRERADGFAMRRANAVLMAVVSAVLGCSRPARPSRSQEPGNTPDAQTSIDVCAGLDPEACGVRGTELSDDPRTEMDALPLLRKACARHDGRSCSNLGTEFSSSMNPKIRDEKKAVAAYSDGCRLGYLTACCHAADLLEAGNGIERMSLERRRLQTRVRPRRGRSDLLRRSRKHLQQRRPRAW